MMKAKTIKTLLVAAITMAAMSVPGTANAQLGGLVKKAKQKAEQVVDKKKEDVKKEAKKAKEDAKMKAIETQRPLAPRHPLPILRLLLLPTPMATRMTG